MSDLSGLNPTPHAIAVYASSPLSPVATQHSLPSGRYSLLGPDFHRLDRTSLRLAHSLDHPVGAGEQRGWHVDAQRLGVLRLITSSYLVGACTGRSAGFSPLRIRSPRPCTGKDVFTKETRRAWALPVPDPLFDLQIYSRLLTAAALNLVVNGLSFVE